MASTEMGKRKLTGGIPASAVAGAPVAAQTAMAQRRTAVARGEIVSLPLYGEAWMQILGNETMEEIEAATWRAMAERGLPPVDIHLGTYNLHRFRRILAAAVRHPVKHDEPFGSLAEWAEEPDEVLAVSIVLYKDVKARLDPVTNPELSEEQAAAVLDAFKKKDFQQLRWFGSALLSSWLLSGAVRLSSSPTPSSSSSDSSAE
jgi:hypothetical protein